MVSARHKINTKCSVKDIYALGLMFVEMDYTPHEVHSGIQLNPYRAHEWRVGDIYWRRHDMPALHQLNNNGILH